MFHLSTGAGYLNVELFSLVIPALFAIVAIGFGAAALAGEQEAGQMDLLLAYPITRGRVVIEKIATLVGMLLVLAMVATASIAIIGALADLGVSIDKVAIASLGAALSALFVGLATMLTGAATGPTGGGDRRRHRALRCLVSARGSRRTRVVDRAIAGALSAVSRNRDTTDPQRPPRW